MIGSYRGQYRFNTTGIKANAPTSFGVYYCGVPDGTSMKAYYVGKAARGDSGIQQRLLDHEAENKWSDVTCFGYKATSTAAEADKLEAAEIKRLNPKYNKVGKLR